MMNMRKLSGLLLLLVNFVFVTAQSQPKFSTAGFYATENSGREVFNMNPAWRFHLGDIDRAEDIEFNDNDWDVVSLPNGIELLPLDASGCVNYQGVVWYRKHFELDKTLKGKKLFIHFEGIMGKSEVYLNGELIKQSFSGYYPVIADITDHLKWNGDNVFAVKADNSDDPNYPPGKAQDVLDFTYFGGIYRDCWLIAHNDVFITDPLYEDKIAGGGLFVAYDKVSRSSADVLLKLNVRNETNRRFKGSVEFDLQTSSGSSVMSNTQNLSVGSRGTSDIKDVFTVKNPALWSPQSPTLYHLVVTVKNNKGEIVDGYMQRIGIRSIEFKGTDGFWLNNEPYPEAVIGGNRHQDFAVIGNALSNSMHWRDAKKLRDAGMIIIRNAHYPQDPAFMDACDELGLFVIENIPGWQFWSNNPEFEDRVYEDIRKMVRRDRNRSSVWLWEPILNETNYPDNFAKKAIDIVYAEYPYNYCYAASDQRAKGSHYYPVIFTHPLTGDKDWAAKESELDPNKVYFTREWGDNVDDWSAQNSSSRISRAWGENPMIVQAKHYEGATDYSQTSYTSFRNTTRHHVGGTLWHSFDHQRGYHPDTFYGGIMDAFRQPKYSFYFFQSQRDPKEKLTIADSGPMIYIANEMTPGSVKDVVVYSNCDSIQLIVNEGEFEYTYKREVDPDNNLRHPSVVFENIFDFMKTKYRTNSEGKRVETSMVAKGYIDGKLAATDKVVNAARPSKIKLWVDNEKLDLIANGSDMVTVIAAIVDDKGNIRRMNNNILVFEIEGEGELMGNAETFTNPTPIRWGTAPVLVRSTTKAGTIKIKAKTLFEGIRTPVEGTLEIHSIPSSMPLVFNPDEVVMGKSTVKTKVTTTNRKEGKQNA